MILKSVYLVIEVCISYLYGNRRLINVCGHIGNYVGFP